MTKKIYVLGFAFNYVGSKVVLIKKNRPDWQKGRLNGVGGKKEDGETLLKAMVREFKEETDLETNEGDWTRKGVLKSSEFEVHIFIARLSHLELCLIKTITDEEVFITDPSLLSNAVPNLHWIIPLMLDPYIDHAVINQSEV